MVEKKSLSEIMTIHYFHCPRIVMTKKTVCHTLHYRNSVDATGALRFFFADHFPRPILLSPSNIGTPSAHSVNHHPPMQWLIPNWLARGGWPQNGVLLSTLDTVPITEWKRGLWVGSTIKRDPPPGKGVQSILLLSLMDLWPLHSRRSSSTKWSTTENDTLSFSLSFYPKNHSTVKALFGSF